MDPEPQDLEAQFLLPGLLDAPEEVEEDHEDPEMANNLQTAEVKIKQKLSDALASMAVLWGLEATRARTRGIKEVVDSLAFMLQDWKENHYKRMAKEAPEAQKAFHEEWLKEFHATKLKVDEEILKYEEIDGVAPPPQDANPNATLAKGKFSILKGKITGTLNHADTIKAKLAEESTTEEVPKAKYTFYAQGLDEVKRDIECLEELISEIITLHPADSEAYMTHYNTEVGKIKASHVESSSALASLKVPDQTFTAVRMSTPRTSFLNPAQPDGPTSTPSTSVKKYQYKLQDLPSFSKDDIASFPNFYKEWKESIMPGNEDAWILRHLNSRTPKEDDLTIFATPDHAWE